MGHAPLPIGVRTDNPEMAGQTAILLQPSEYLLSVVELFDPVKRVALMDRIGTVTFAGSLGIADTAGRDWSLATARSPIEWQTILLGGI